VKFHHQGYVSGDPRIQPAQGSGIDRPTDLPDRVDVLIVGAGPAGILAAAQLAQFPDIDTRIVERRCGRLEVGQADGIQPRSVETFQAFGFADRIVAEGCLIVETAFWKPDPQAPERIVRTSRVLEDPNGVSEFPHITVNQARVLDYFAEAMANAPRAWRRTGVWSSRTCRWPTRASTPSPSRWSTAAAPARARPAACARATWWAPTARTAGCAAPSAARPRATAPTTPGA
jgi:cation diffusion facilitator CzcD-associated flavoprotein CzcO